jgi:hypothetical protein
LLELIFQGKGKQRCERKQMRLVIIRCAKPQKKEECMDAPQKRMAVNRQFLDFIKKSLPEEEKHIQTRASHFEMLDVQHLQTFHYPKSLIASRTGNWYQYRENNNTKDDLINLIATTYYTKNMVFIKYLRSGLLH